jgi:hypothetical protein
MKKNYKYNYKKEELKKKPQITNYLHRNKKLKKGIILKKFSFEEIVYPFSMNLKLVNEFLKKK